MERVNPDRRVSLAQQLVLELSRSILAGELPAGTKLPTEQAFTEARKVSRTVVREAMSRLQAEGLVETRRGIGTFVVDTTRPGDFQDSQHEKGSALDAVAPLHQDSTRIVFEFHLQIALCTGNSFFIDAMRHLADTLMRGAQNNVTQQQRAQQVREREQIYAALAHQDADAARAAMRLHLTNELHRAQPAAQPSA